MPSRPLEIHRRISLFLSFAFSGVGFAVGLNALIKANHERSYINRLVAPYGIIDIGIHAIFTTGAFITAICALLSILSCILFISMWCPVEHKASSFRIQSWALYFCAAWLFATLASYDYFFATRSAQITVNLHGQRVPETVIRHFANLFNFTYAYRDVYFLRLLAVLPWLSFISAVVAGVLLDLTAARVEASSNVKHQAGRSVIFKR